MCAYNTCAPGKLSDGLLSYCLAGVKTSTESWTLKLLGVHSFCSLSFFFFLHLYLANEFNILLQCSYTSSSASFALAPPPPLFVVMMTTMIITRFCHKAKQCSFLVIFLCTAVLFFFSPCLCKGRILSSRFHR